MDTFVARQPVFDRQRDVFGYELLFRSGPDNFFCCADGDHASSKVMSDSMNVHGLHVLTSGRRAFVNVTRRVLLDGLFTVLPPDRTVVELLETIVPDAEVIAACRKVRRAGYLLALDDFLLEERDHPLLSEVDILKVDFLETTPQQRRDFAARAAKSNFALLAEKVETHEEFAEAAKLNYVYFQGDFFCKPQMVRNRDVRGLKLNYLRFLQKINQPELDLRELEEILRQDVSLSYKLLKYLNSAAFGLRHKVHSLTHAMSLMGTGTLRKWASLVATTSLADDKPHELMLVCLVRAWFCEHAAGPLRLGGLESDLFLTGMFSVIDAMVDRPMAELLEEMPVSDDVRATLLGEPTALSVPYRMVRALEGGRWGELEELTGAAAVDGNLIMNTYRGALEWGSEVCRQSAATEVRRAG